MKYILAFLICFAVLFAVALFNVSGRESDWERLQRWRDEPDALDRGDDIDYETEGDEFNG